MNPTDKYAERAREIYYDRDGYVPDKIARALEQSALEYAIEKLEQLRIIPHTILVHDWLDKSLTELRARLAELRPSTKREYCFMCGSADTSVPHKDRQGHDCFGTELRPEQEGKEKNEIPNR